VACGLGLASPAAASAASRGATYLFVAPSGTGKDCTSISPCALRTAQADIEADRTAKGHRVVQLAGGTYRLASALTFGSADSGRPGAPVSYQAAPGQTPVLSGGQAITGWKLHDRTRDIYVASVPKGFKTRQLYVDGQRAVLANEDAGTALGTMKQTATGYTVSNRAIDHWSDPKGLDFSYPSQGQDPASTSGTWTDSFCGVAAVAGRTVTMDEPCYKNATTNPTPVVGLPAFVENAYALLSGPGQFYVDSAAGRIYYRPSAGQDMAEASVVAPLAQSLLRVRSARDLQFIGLTFEYATWTPSTSEGVVDTQANELQTTDYAQASLMPSDVSFSHCNHVLFERNTLTHLGGAALSFDGGGGLNVVIGNTITDVSGTGINIGDGDSYTSPPVHMESGDVVEDNVVHDVAVEYQGGAGIFAGWVTNTTIDHNDVSDVPWVGISLGWGWNSAPTAMANNHIDDNVVEDALDSSIFDGGAIYVNNGQRASGHSTIRGNYVLGDPLPYGAIYLDSGASNYDVADNVVSQTSTNWVYLQTGPNPASNNTVEDNFSNASAMVPGNSTNTVTQNETGLKTEPAAAQAITAAAGLQAPYAHLAPADADLSSGTPAFSSSSASSAYAAAEANDGNALSGWISASGDSHPYWETDLGASRSLASIAILLPLGSDVAAERRNFEVWVSNSEAMTPGHFTLACRQGPDPVPYGSSFECALPLGPWRYVALVKTDGQPFALAEVRIFGN
jgi:hypothetical protein